MVRENEVAANEVVAEEEKIKITLEEEDFLNKFENTLNYFFNYNYKLE